MWKGEQAKEPSQTLVKDSIDVEIYIPSSCSTTITSIAPLSVAGLMEFHVLDTEPPMLRTYCMSRSGRSYGHHGLRFSRGALTFWDDPAGVAEQWSSRRWSGFGVSKTEYETLGKAGREGLSLLA